MSKIDKGHIKLNSKKINFKTEEDLDIFLKNTQMAKSRAKRINITDYQSNASQNHSETSHHTLLWKR